MTRHHRPTATLLLAKIERQTAIRFPGRRSDWRFESLRGEDRTLTGWKWRMTRSEIGGLEIGSPDSADSVLTANRLLVVPEAGQIEVKVVRF